ncbi:RHS repeat-associated core domain-containing protein [Chitinophaga sp. ARDCPP14]|uniref:RHS repeat-associated core domain-containing protein n=1 Tax=Chitinophaga sp. ARDCPP14 TaxID=3391139 RepID=UPI003F529033
MVGESVGSGSGEVYRYGFNGKENDNEVKGEGNQQDYGMRVYDPRIGKFLSVDPLTPQYPWYTPYQFAGNNPVKFIDMDGLEPVNVSVSGNQIVYNGGFIVNAADIYRITYLNVVLGLKLPSNLNTSSNPYDDRDPYNRDTWEKAYQNVSYFFSHHAPAYSRSEAATRTIHTAIAKGLLSGSDSEAESAIAQIDKSEDYAYRNSLAKDGLFYGSLVNDLRTLAVKTIFKSDDKYVQMAIDGIAKVDPNAIYAVEVLIRNPKTGMDITDFDIVMKKFIVEVTGGKGGGKLEQVATQRLLAPNKEIVVFGPKVGGTVEKNLKEQNVKLFRKVEDLVKYVTSEKKE